MYHNNILYLVKINVFKLKFKIKLLINLIVIYFRRLKNCYQNTMLIYQAGHFFPVLSNIWLLDQ